jgi:hypothetical protein
MTTKEQFQVFNNNTDAADGTWKIGSLTGLYFRDLVNKLGKPSVIGSGDDKVQYEWIMKFEGEIFTIYDWKTYDAEYTEYELDTWSVGGNDQSVEIVSDFKKYIYGL